MRENKSPRTNARGEQAGVRERTLDQTGLRIRKPGEQGEIRTENQCQTGIRGQNQGSSRSSARKPGKHPGVTGRKPRGSGGRKKGPGRERSTDGKLPPGSASGPRACCLTTMRQRRSPSFFPLPPFVKISSRLSYLPPLPPGCLASPRMSGQVHLRATFASADGRV